MLNLILGIILIILILAFWEVLLVVLIAGLALYLIFILLAVVFGFSSDFWNFIGTVLLVGYFLYLLDRLKKRWPNIWQWLKEPF